MPARPFLVYGVACSQSLSVFSFEYDCMGNQTSNGHYARYAAAPPGSANRAHEMSCAPFESNPRPRNKAATASQPDCNASAAAGDPAHWGVGPEPAVLNCIALAGWLSARTCDFP